MHVDEGPEVDTVMISHGSHGAHVSNASRSSRPCERREMAEAVDDIDYLLTYTRSVGVRQVVDDMRWPLPRGGARPMGCRTRMGASTTLATRAYGCRG